MFCPNCGSSVNDDEKFCPNCGANLSAGTQETQSPNNISTEGQEEKNPTQPMADYNGMPVKKSGSSKSALVINIIYIIAAVLLLYDGIRLISFDWGLLALASGIGLLVIGILGIVKPDKKIISIVSIVDGAIMLILALMCASGFDWTYIGYMVAILMLASGILGLVKVSGMITSIVEIIIAAILLIFGFMCSDFVWGDIAMFVSIPFLVRAIINIVTSRRK